MASTEMKKLRKRAEDWISLVKKVQTLNINAKTELAYAA